MTIAEALGIVVALAALATLVGGVGWLFVKMRPAAEARYVTIARLEEALTQQQLRHDAAMLAMDRRLAAAVARQDALEHALDEEQEKRRLDHARLSDVQRRMEAWMAYARQLADIIRRELKTEPPPEPTEPPPMVARVASAPALVRRIAALFSRGEIDSLAFEIGLDNEVAGETTELRAASLVKAAQRRELLEMLIDICHRERPRGGFR